MKARRLLVPEVVQTSAMDCGPAALAALLQGHGVACSYGRLREACQTDVDGTSVDTLEDVAVRLGLDAEQVVVPVDHVLREETRNLPAIVVVRLPNGLTHFVVAWRRHRGRVQVMDPGSGRRWMRGDDFLSELYVHRMAVPAEAWREWAGDEEFLVPLDRRLREIGATPAAARELVASASADEGWRPLAKLDAATRMVTRLVETRALKPGAAAVGVVRAAMATDADVVPDRFWSARPTESDEEVQIEGAVLVRVRGRKATEDEAPALSPELSAAMTEAPPRPWATLWGLVASDGAAVVPAIVGGVLVAAGGTVLEALLWRALVDAGDLLRLGQQRLFAFAGLAALGLALLAVDLATESGLLRLGRRLDARLRVAFLSKIPRLGDRYFSSRLASDMADRGHNLHHLRTLPQLAGVLARAVAGIAFAVAGIVWLDGRSAPLAILCAAVSVGVPLLGRAVLEELDLRQRTHGGALSRVYLDALLGLSPVRTHGAERAVLREQEGLLVEWGRAGLALYRTVVAVEGIQLFLGFGLAALLVLQHLDRAGAGSALLMAWWALWLPSQGEQVALVVRQVPQRRNVTLRVLEPLGAPEEPRAEAAEPGTGPIAVSVHGVDVVAGGHPVLREVDFELRAGEHVAIVGPSGAGKSTLVGLLLGWHRAVGGEVRVDGKPLDAAQIERVRRRAAWVDPAVQLWNRSFLDNLAYGAPGGAAFGEVLGAARLRDVLEGLPEGMQTPLGEGGGQVSGGQGQRVRLGRALLRRDAGLVLLDEPFRGLDRHTRHALLDEARRWWAGATMIYVTHDVAHALAFDRVVVVEAGRIVEDGPPKELAATEGRFRALLDAEAALATELWGDAAWRRLRLSGGRVEGA